MGNYMETCIQREKTDDHQNLQVQQKITEEEENQDSRKVRGNYGMKSSRMRVKLVLTKDELEWLLVQMKKKEGKRLEDVLEGIEKSRMKGKSVAVAGGWKPSLESIMETPEVCHEMNR